MAATLTDIFRILKELLEETVKKSPTFVASPRGRNVIFNTADITSGLASILSELQTHRGILDTLDLNTDDIESLLTALGVNTDGIEGLLTAIDALLTTIDTSTDEIEGKQDTGNTSLGNIDTATDGLNSKFGILGSMGLLIISIQATIILITAQLEKDGENAADLLTSIKALLTTIDTDTGNIQANTANTSGNTFDMVQRLDRQFADEMWDFEATYTCTVAGTLIITWPIIATHYLTQLYTTLLAFPLAVSKNMQWNIVRTVGATTIQHLARLTIISLQLISMKDQPWRGKLLGNTDSLVLGTAIAASFAIGDLLRVSIRSGIRISGGGGPTAPVPAITGTGTFTQVIVSNQILTHGG